MVSWNIASKKKLLLQSASIFSHMMNEWHGGLKLPFNSLTLDGVITNNDLSTSHVISDLYKFLLKFQTNLIYQILTQTDSPDACGKLCQECSFHVFHGMKILSMNSVWRSEEGWNSSHLSHFIWNIIYAKRILMFSPHFRNGKILLKFSASLDSSYCLREEPHKSHIISLVRWCTLISPKLQNPA